MPCGICHVPEGSWLVIKSQDFNWDELKNNGWDWWFWKQKILYVCPNCSKKGKPEGAYKKLTKDVQQSVENVHVKGTGSSNAESKVVKATVSIQHA